MHEFSEEEYNLMKKYGGTCLKCGCKNSIQEKRVLSDEERSEIEEIEKKDNLLEREQYQLLKLLQYSRKDKTATELAQELDVSWQKIGWNSKKNRGRLLLPKKKNHEREKCITFYLIWEENI